MSNTAPPTPRNLHLNTFTRRTSRVTLTLPAATTEELRKQGIEAPAEVHFLFCECNYRERQAFEKGQSEVGHGDPSAWVAGLLMSRAETGTDPRVVQELVYDMSPSTVAVMLTGYLQGELPDQDQVATVLANTSRQLTDVLLQELAR